MNKTTPGNNCTPRQLKLPLDLENIINISDHTHVVSDTKNGDTTAYASESEHGFMTKEDVQKLENLLDNLDTIDIIVEDIV